MSEPCQLCGEGQQIRRVRVLFEKEDGTYDREASALMNLCADCREECRIQWKAALARPTPAPEGEKRKSETD